MINKWARIFHRNLAHVQRIWFSQAPTGNPLQAVLSLAISCKGGVRLPVLFWELGGLTPVGLGGAD